MELIDKELLIKKLRNWIYAGEEIGDKETVKSLQTILYFIDKVPIEKITTIQKWGRCRYNTIFEGSREYLCPKCNMWNFGKTPYCSNCGSRMEAEK